MAQFESNDRPSRTFPSSLPPQLVISWLQVSDVASALCASSIWHGESAAVFQIIAQSRGLETRLTDYLRIDFQDPSFLGFELPWSE